MTFRKLEGEFYDTGEMRIAGLGSQEARTRDIVAKSAEWLNSNLNLGISPEVLITNVKDDSGMPNDLRAKLIRRFETNPSETESIVETAAILDWNKLGYQRKPAPFFFDQNGKHYYGSKKPK